MQEHRVLHDPVQIAGTFAAQPVGGVIPGVIVPHGVRQRQGGGAQKAENVLIRQQKLRRVIPHADKNILRPDDFPRFGQVHPRDAGSPAAV